MNAADHTQVIIVGAGPVGLTLANLLGLEGIDTLVIERNPGTVPEPRAIALDGESLRTLQAAGLAETVTATLREGFIADYVNGEGTQLFVTDLNPRPYGFCLQNSFDQPTLEQQLLAGLARFPNVTVLFETVLEQFSQDGTGVTAAAVTQGETSRSINCDYLIGCDGGRSTVRQQLGVEMVGDRLPQHWLVVDTIDHSLGEEPQCRFYCDPARPAMTMIRPGDERRWEWMLLDGEENELMLEDASIRALLAPHTSANDVDIYRKAVYGFSAVVAERFSSERVFLAGDAAHMTPPFAGQGLNAGIRDVRNLSWKLVAVLRDSFPETLLETYQLERHDAAQDIVDLAIALGDQIQPTDAAVAAERDAFFAELNKEPGAGAKFGHDLVAPLHDVRMTTGWFAQDSLAGRFLPQPEIESNGVTQLLDESFSAGFVAIMPPGESLPDAITSHALWQTLAPQLLVAPKELGPFLEGAGAVVLLRPDRFVLAQLPLDETGVAVLDSLQERL